LERPSTLPGAASLQALEASPEPGGVFPPVDGGTFAAVRGAALADERAVEEASGFELAVTGVTKRFGPVTALSDVSLTVASGEFVTILGPSGCGKTTLLRIVAGLEVADGGQVFLGGNDITRLPAHKRHVNTVFQNYALFPHLDVYENIAFGLRSRRFPAEEVDARVRAALEMLHLEEMPRRRTFQLSGGQKQRVALARALVNQPDVLLLDEPMSALDAKLRAEVQLELRRLQRRLGKTFVLVTHDQNEAMTVSDRIFVMYRGRIVEQNTAEAVMSHPSNEYTIRLIEDTPRLDRLWLRPHDSLVTHCNQ